MKILQEYWASTVIFIEIFSQCIVATADSSPTRAPADEVTAWIFVDEVAAGRSVPKIKTRVCRDQVAMWKTARYEYIAETAVVEAVSAMLVVNPMIVNINNDYLHFIYCYFKTSYNEDEQNFF